MHRETLRLWSILKKGSLFCVVFLLVSLTLEIRTYLSASATRDVALVWSRPPEQDVAGYNVYYGPVSRYEETFDEYLYEENLRLGDYEVQDTEVRYVLNDVDANLTYWVAVTAYDHDGNESLFSNEKKIGAAAGTTTAVSSSGGCQTLSPLTGPSAGTRAEATGWFCFGIAVPAWILLLRKRLSRPSSLVGTAPCPGTVGRASDQNP
jgi:hypothetical protein